MKISLIGFTGVGKTQVGRALAERLHVEFYDLDKTIEAKTTQSVTELLGKYGIEQFRNMESEVLTTVLGHGNPCVIATGGGTLNRPINRTQLKNKTLSIWLRGLPETIWRRVQDKPYVAPLFFTRQDPLMSIKIEMTRREPHYEEVAKLAIDIDGKTPQQVAEEIKEGVELSHD